MSKIQLLPESLANQIAAGEVVQRPASVVKELIENSVDAGSTRIELMIEQAGKSLIQVLDNGCGMSATDARMCFERHATSKIKSIDDLFRVATFGFRGEAMASIAAVSQISLKTRCAEDELGVHLELEAGNLKHNALVPFQIGASVSVKNLFFNVPARRNFLKSNPVETRHILQEFYHVALARPNISLRFEHNGDAVHDLASGELLDRILQLYGHYKPTDFLAVAEETPLVKIWGYVGSPDVAKKARGDQYFFVNKRFIKNGYLHHAVASAFAETLPNEHQPFYAIFIELDPKHIDINIHPTKTEIKFDDDRLIYAMLHSAVRQSLGKMHQTPDFDFKTRKLDAIQSALNTSPSNDEFTLKQYIHKKQFDHAPKNGLVKNINWEELYLPQPEPEQENRKPEFARNPSPETVAPSPAQLFESSDWPAYQLYERFVAIQKPEGLLLIDQSAAFQRIVFERFVRLSREKSVPIQKMLFPQTLNFTVEDALLLKEAQEDLTRLGFDLSWLDGQKLLVAGIPMELKQTDLQPIFDQILNSLKETGEIHDTVVEALALTVANRSAAGTGKKMTPPEMQRLTKELFACQTPQVTPNGRKTYILIGLNELERFFQ